VVDITGTATEFAGASGQVARPKRADAVKNRDRILRAAQEVFAAEGVGAPIDVVARRAGVGIGTLYRNFPTKESLFEAIVVANLQELLALANRLADAPDRGAAFFAFLEEFTAVAVTKRDLRDALEILGVEHKARFAATISDLENALDVLLRRAVDAGAVRGDVNAPEVLSLLAGACKAGEGSGLDAESCLRMAHVVCAGLRPDRA
jgi:AcrR family transcriptional regulator